MQVIVHLAPEVAQEINEGNARSANAAGLVRTLQDLGFELRPMHPGALDPGLRATFFLEAADLEQAKQVVTRLQALDATKAAYLKPPPAMP